MRIAFIGGVNRGKSTLMNAFLGEKLAETGNRELTCNVSWFRYGDRRELRVHLDDGSVDAFGDLAALTTRCDASPHFVDRIRFIEVLQPSPVLRDFDLIDTPGLYSTRPANSAITREFLANPETKPHAIVFLFCNTFREEDAKELELFQAGNSEILSGINAIAAITKAESLKGEFAGAERIADQIRTERPMLARRFYRIVPVAGQAGFAAQTFTSEDMETIKAVARLSASQIDTLLGDADEFVNLDFGFGEPPAAARDAVFERFGLWGIRRAVEAAATGGGPEVVRDALLSRSRLDALRNLVVDHFGRRAELIRCSGVLAEVRDEAFHAAETVPGEAGEAAGRIVIEADSIRNSDPRFISFDVLKGYYTGQGGVRFEDHEVRWLLEITGENGTDCGSRLGEPPLSAATPEAATCELLADKALKRESYWRSRSMAFVSPAAVDAYRRLADCNADLRTRLLAAAERLRAASDLLEV